MAEHGRCDQAEPQDVYAVGSLAGTGLLLGAAGAIYGSSIGLSGRN